MLSPQCGKVNLDPLAGRRLAYGPLRRFWYHEENLSAAQSAACQQARIPGTDEHPLGTSGAQSAAQEGPQASRSVAAVQARGALRSEGIPRNWRLTRTPDMAAVQRQGRRRRTPRLDIAWRGNALGHPRFGLVVPRLSHTVVSRNRLRRRLREIVRRRVLTALGPTDVVIRSRADAYRASFSELSGDLESWVRSLSG